MKARNSRVILLVVLVLTVFLLTACGGHEAAYKQAQELTAQGKYTEAAEKYAAIPEYEDAAVWKKYCDACALCEAGNYEAGIAALEALGDFGETNARIAHYTVLAGPEYTYKKAQSLLSQSKYAQAAEKFESLGSYEDAATLTIYCKACALCEDGDFEAGIAALEKLGEYKDCAMRISYYTARSWDDNSVDTNEFEWMERAKSIYTQNPLYLDSAERIAALSNRIAEARKTLYDEAVKAGEDAQYDAAIATFKRLVNYSDSSKRITYYTARSWDDGSVGTTEFERMEQAKSIYNENPLYLDSAERIIALDERIAAAKKVLYDEAVTAGEDAQFDAAITTFKRLGSYSDSNSLLAYYSTRKLETEADLSDYVTLTKIITAYRECGDIKDSAARIDQLKPYWDASMLVVAKNFSIGDSDLAAFEVNKRYGFLNIKTGEVVIEPQWDYAESFSEGLARVKKNGKWGFIDTTGKVVIKPQWDVAYSFSEGLVCVEKNGKWGFIDTTGKVVIEPQWDDVSSFFEGHAKVEKSGKWGFIDTTGKVVIEPQWDDEPYFVEGLAYVERNGKWGYIDAAGKVVGELQWDYNYYHDFSEGLAFVEKDDKYGYIDSNGKVVSEPQWDNARPFSEGLACVEKNGKYGYIDTTGKVVIEPQWDVAYSFSEGLAPVRKDGTWRIIDATGKVVSEPQWDFYYLHDFSEGIAKVEKNGKFGYIDTTGKVVSEMQWDLADPFSEGIAKVEKNGKCVYIDTTGKVVSEMQWDITYDFSDGLARVYKDGKYGYINTKGEIVIGFGVVPIFPLK